MNGSDDARRAELLRLAGEVADATPVNWGGHSEALEDSDAGLEGLKLIERLETAHRELRGGVSGHGRAGEGMLFRWGALEAMEKLGEGSFGEVFRAFDPTLRREVALKLRRAGQGGDRRFLDEARRLARVAHPHVLHVHGADVHEGRAGLWTDLLRGRTLEEHLSAQVRLGAPEATLIGLDLCRALAAVHAAGLVHGDVKAANVMREEGGRIVLMDFGSVSEQSGSGAASHGTPLALAPEILEGAAPSPSTDVYALGVLLFRLVSGRYPVEAPDLPRLREEHRAGRRASLRDLRPDIPTAFVQVVEQALEKEPETRFRSAAGMEAALAATMHPAAPAAPRRRGALPMGLAAAALAAVIAVVVLRQLPRATPDTGSSAAVSALPRGGAATWSSRGGPGEAPKSGLTASAAVLSANPGTVAADTLDFSARLCRGGDGGEQFLAAGDEVHPGDHLYLKVRAARPVNVYVLNEDDHGSLYVLFPVSGSDQQNPVSPGELRRLPGRFQGQEQDWQVTSAGGRETFLVIASPRPLRAFEERLAALERSESGRMVAYAELRPSDLQALRGVGGMAPAALPTHVAPGSRLAGLAKEAREGAESPIRVRSFMLSNPGN